MTGHTRLAGVALIVIVGVSRIRVTPELTEVASSGAPTARWRDSFDAVLDDVFRVQGEIAVRVAGALQLTLGSREQETLAGRPTDNLDAYEAYMRGRALVDSVDTQTLRRAAGYLETAVSLDPSFAKAWANLSVTRSLLYVNGIPAPEVGEASRSAAERSLQLAPGGADSRFALSSYLRLVVKDNARALEESNKGLAVDANNVDLLASAAASEMSLGRWEPALAHLERAQSLDPRSAGMAVRRGFTLLWMRRYPQALAAYDLGLTLMPSSVRTVHEKAMVFLAQGDRAGARACLDGRPAEVPLAEVTTYARSLSSITGGRGSYAIELSHYDIVPGNVQQEIIAKAQMKEEEEE